MRGGGFMLNRKEILKIYNAQGKKQINESDLITILPHLYMIINKLNPDDKDLELIVNGLISIKYYGYYDRITSELVDLTKKLVNNNISEFISALMIILFPYNLNYEGHIIAMLININKLLFLIVDQIKKGYIDQHDLEIIGTYNSELKHMIYAVKNVNEFYEKFIKNDKNTKKKNLIYCIICHMIPNLYIRLKEFDFRYDLLLLFIGNIINNPQIYSLIVNLCITENIYSICSKSDEGVTDNIYEEAAIYKVTQKILESFYQFMEEKEKSGERNDGQYSGN